METRKEKDTFGEIEVPAHQLWGAQTQRSLKHFSISTEKMPWPVVRGLIIIKKAAAIVNLEIKAIDEKKCGAIIAACDEALAERHLSEFPLSVWQTGSGTQTNMNVNEVIANRASEILGGSRGEKRLVHPNDDVNRSQSSNDTFPTAMHIAALEALSNSVIPSLLQLKDSLKKKASEFSSIIKIGRTHLMDATPITLEQELSGHVAQLEMSLGQLEHVKEGLRLLAIGGTAVGTGLNAPKGFDQKMSREISKISGQSFQPSPNKFEALSSCDEVVDAHAALKRTAVALFKIANDLRWLGSGPRSGLGELSLPETEPGSSIMPGKVNPTQCEAMTMAATRIMGNDVTISIAGASGNFQLNVFRPVIIDAFLQSCRLITDGCQSFRKYCVEGMQANKVRIKENLDRSLMLVTALAPHIGYDKCAQMAKKAHKENSTLLEAGLSLGFVTEEQFRDWVKPEDMV